MPVVTAEEVESAAKEAIRFPSNRKWEPDKDARIRPLFGASSKVIAELWNRIEAKVHTFESGAKLKHLLWALVFLKVYSTRFGTIRRIGRTSRMLSQR